MQLIKEDISNIIYATTWAKSNTINYFVFTSTETTVVEDIFKKENDFLFNIEELLEFAKVKLATNGNDLTYIISLPTIKTDNCRPLKIKAIKKAQVVNNINYANLLEYKRPLFAIKNPCESHNDKTICISENLLDLSNDTCLNALLNLRKPEHKMINNQHITDFEEILPGTILLNDFKVSS